MEDYSKQLDALRQLRSMGAVAVKVTAEGIEAVWNGPPETQPDLSFVPPHLQKPEASMEFPSDDPEEAQKQWMEMALWSSQ